MPPNIVTEVEDLVAIRVRLGDIKVAPNQGDQDRVKYKVKEFEEEFGSFVRITLTRLLTLPCWLLKPLDVGCLMVSVCALGLCMQNKHYLEALCNLVQRHGLEPSQPNE